MFKFWSKRCAFCVGDYTFTLPLLLISRAKVAFPAQQTRLVYEPISVSPVLNTCASQIFLLLSSSTSSSNLVSVSSPVSIVHAYLGNVFS